MKLHLPTRLLAAVLACVFAAGTTYADATYVATYAEQPNVININFASNQGGGTTVGKTGEIWLPYGGDLFSYNADSSWNNVTGGSSSEDVSVSDTNGNTYTLTWSSFGMWSSSSSVDTLTGAITKGYLDISNSTASSATFTLSATDADAILDWKQVNIIFSGDDNKSFGYVTVDGTNYYYDAAGVLKTGNLSWGTREGFDYVQEGANLMCVTKKSESTQQNSLTVTGNKIDGNSRASIAGVQIVLGGTTNTNAATGGAISGLAEGESATVSGLGLPAEHSGRLTVNITATEDIDTDVATLIVDHTLTARDGFDISGGALKLDIQENTSLRGLSYKNDGSLAEVSIADGKKLSLGDELTSFTSTKVTGSGTLELSMGDNSADTGSGIVRLGTGSDIGTVRIASGVFATNNNDTAKGADLGAAELRMANNTTYLVRNGVGNSANVTTGGIELEGAMTLRVRGGVGEATTLSSNISSVEGSTTSIKKTDGGTLTLTGKVDIDALYVSAGTLKLGSGANVTVSQVRLSENGSNNNKLIVGEGAKLTVAGNNNDHSTGASVLLAHWEYTGCLEVDGGSFTAKDAEVHMSWTGTGTMTLKSGTAEVKGLNFWAQDPGTFRGKLNLEGGTLKLGASGIANVNSSAELDFGNATIQLQAAANIAHNASYGVGTVNLLGTSGGTVFDTQGYDMTVSVPMTGEGKLKKSGTGKLTLNGALTAGGITVNAGTLQLNAQTTVSTTIVNEGTLAFGTNGSLAIADLAGFEQVGTATYSDTLSGSTQNGYANASYIVVTGAGTVTGLDSVTLHGSTYELTADNEGNRVMMLGGTGGDYYVNEGAVVYGAAGNSAASGATTGIVLNGGDLTLATGLTEQAKSDTGIVANRAATVTINENVTLSSADLAAHAATTLAGGGTYDLGSANALGDNIALGDAWTGTVRLSGSHGGPFNINTYANENSKVRLVGASAWLQMNTPVTREIILENGEADDNGDVYGLKISAVSSKTYTFSGKVSGGGNFVVANGGDGTSATYEFTGDVSDWSGRFVNSGNGGHNRNLKFSGSATNINAAIEHAGSAIFAVTIENGSDVQIGGAISNTSTGTLTLTTAGNGTKTFANTVEASSISISGGAVDFDAAVATGTLTVGAATTMSDLTLSGAATLDAGLTVSGSTTLSGGDASITIADGGAFTSGNETVSKLAADTSAVISGTGLVSVATESITYANALIDVTAASDISTINAILLNSEVRNSNSSVGVSVSAGSLADGTNDVTAAEGNITIDNIGDNGVTVKNLTVQEGNTISASTADGGGSPATINVAGTAALENGSTVGGSVTIADSGTLVIGGTGFSADGFGAMVEGTLTANATAISLAEGSKIDVTGITTSTTYVLATALGMDIAGDFAVGNFYTGTLAEGMSVSVSVVQPMGGGTYAVDQAAASQLVLTLTAAAPGTLTQTAVAENGVSVNGTNITLTVTDSLAGVTGGFNVTVGKEAWQAIVDGMAPGGGIYQNATVTLTDGTNTLDWSSAEGPVTLNKYAGTGTKGEYFVAYIPEPATATLSLLALAALAARRRRK